MISPKHCDYWGILFYAANEQLPFSANHEGQMDQCRA
jgi:hypothetical protein